MTEPIPVQVQAKITWGDVDSLPVLAASHFIVQAAVHDAPDVNDFILTLGYLPPPLFLGTPEQQVEAAAAMSQVTVRPLARFSIPKAKAAELAQILSNMVQAAESQDPQS